MKKDWLLVLILIILIIIFSGVSILVGVVKVDDLDLFILSTTRFPRTAALILSGVAISLCGLIMQHLTQNKFVSPTTLGTNEFAKFGVMLSAVFFSSLNFLGSFILSFVVTMLGTIGFLKLINRMKYKDKYIIPLAGIMVGYIVSAITSFIVQRLDIVQNANGWLIADFSQIMEGNYEFLYIIIPLVIIAYIYADYICVAGLGEQLAKNLGVNYNLIVNFGLIIVSLCTVTTVLTVGIIPFVGLIIPNIVTILKGDNLKNNLIFVVLFGALFLLICDIFSRVIIYPYEINISITTSIIGAFIFIYLVIRKVNNEA